MLVLCMWPLLVDGMVRHYKFTVSNLTCLFPSTGNTNVQPLAGLLYLPEIQEMKFGWLVQVVMKNTTRLCSSKPIVTVNGKFPGPTLYAREGDNVLVKVTNHVKYNVTIHW